MKRYLALLLLGMVLLAIGLLVVSVPPAEADPPKEKCKDSPSVCLIKKYWEGDDAAALRVAKCESHYEPSARRPGSQYTGVFQIGVDVHAERIANLGYSKSDMTDAGKNTKVAHDLWLDSGWGPWECKP